MKAGLSKIKDRLSRLFGYSHAVLFGRARAGIAAVAELTCGRSKDVVIPSNICPAVIAALNGQRVFLASVERDTGLVADGTYAWLLKQNDNIGLIMPTHLYGCLAKFDKTLELAKIGRHFILENDSLAVCAFGRNSKSKGDALLVSFGNGKTIDAGGGGAILTDDRSFANSLAEMSMNWPVLTETAKSIEEKLTVIRRHGRSLGRPELSEAIADIDAENSRHKFSELLIEPLAFALDRFEIDAAARAEKIYFWEKSLLSISDEVMPTMAPIAPWRLVRRVRRPELRRSLVDALRSAGFDAGTNYPPLSEQFPIRFGSQKTSDADEWGRSVLNLWLSSDYDKRRINDAVSVMERVVVDSVA